MPSQLSTTASVCSLLNITSSCTVTNQSVFTIVINAAIAAQTNITIQLTNFLNPITTTPTSSFIIKTYYQNLNQLVDQLLANLTVTAKSVTLQSAQLTPTSKVVGATTNYVLLMQTTNNLPITS